MKNKHNIAKKTQSKINQKIFESMNDSVHGLTAPGLLQAFASNNSHVLAIQQLLGNYRCQASDQVLRRIHNNFLFKRHPHFCRRNKRIIRDCWITSITSVAYVSNSSYTNQLKRFKTFKKKSTKSLHKGIKQHKQPYTMV